MNLKYLPSQNVDMFPITIPRNVDTKQHAHALSEYNLLSLSRHYSDMDSFVISTQFNNPTDKDVSCLECIIHGYYVNLQFTTTILSELTDNVYATIVLDNWKRENDPPSYTPKLVYSDYPPLVVTDSVPPSESSQDGRSDVEAQSEDTDTDPRYLGVVLSDSVPENVNDLLAVKEYLNREYNTEGPVPDCSAYTLKILTKPENPENSDYIIPPESMYKLTSRSISNIDGGEY